MHEAGIMRDKHPYTLPRERMQDPFFKKNSINEKMNRPDM